MRKMLSVGRKEVKQILRDRRTLLVLLFVPAFFLLVYGYALNWDIRHVALAVEDRDRSSASRSLVAAFVNSGYFDLVADVRSPDQITDLMNHGTARVVLVIPDGLSRDLESHVLIEEAAQSITGRTEDVKEGRLSFIEGREPKFQGR